LHVTLAALFVSLFLIFGLSLTLFNSVENRRMALLAANDLTARIDAHLRSTIRGLYQPAQGFVDLASKTLDPGADTLKARLAWLDAFAEALRQNPDGSSIFVGFDDGVFFLARSLRGRPHVALRLAAPAAATLAVQSVERGADRKSRARLQFFDDQLGLVGEREQDSAFDPRERDWYRAASARSQQITTDLYVFFTTGEIGVSFARRLARGRGVVGVDLSLDEISAALAGLRVTPGTRIAVVDPGLRVIALSEPERLAGPKTRHPRLAELGDPVYGALAARLSAGTGAERFELEAGGRVWLVARSVLPTRHDAGLVLATRPRDELLAPVDRIRNGGILISLALIALAVLAVLIVSRNVSASLRALAAEAREIRRFRLSTPMTATSRIAEVEELASTMAVMKTTLEKSFAISRALSTEKDARRLLEMILREARKIANADGGAILMASEDGTALEVAILEHGRAGIHVGGTSGVEPSSAPVLLTDAGAAKGRPTVDLEVVRTGAASCSTTSMPPGPSTRRPCATVRPARRARQLADERAAGRPAGGVAGLLQLVDPRSPEGTPAGFDLEVVPAIEALAADAAVALDLRRLLRAQKQLLFSLIHLLAGAIDAKSPYTHGHCQRVPEIARRLARAAQEAREGPLAGFALSDDEWEQLHIASWLHDCGKVTTPEYVVDKATRLETLNNRIHEIRTRFEVLWRDAELECQRALAAGRPEAEARAELERERERLRDDWSFVAECNLGETLMDDDRLERLRRIGGRTWIRNFDDRLGLSHEELARRRAGPDAPPPAPESLLVDAPHHVVPRPNAERPFGNNPHGFRMEVPERLYHHGELYNLGIRRGTLTTEERFKINEHIVQTIEMLGRLPFPRELARAAEWAGNHHEKLDGTGYPRRLSAAELSIPARIVAVADVFEALTATDRPYMRPKTLSKALQIMASMRDEGHLDPDLFDLLLTSGLYAEYGREYLQQSQNDDVDVAALRRPS
jgi:HD-GYP domain-containing protein (c-di-GMP phosphodiesterase class II)/HAMP domain-containing protein